MVIDKIHSIARPDIQVTARVSVIRSTDWSTPRKLKSWLDRLEVRRVSYRTPVGSSAVTVGTSEGQKLNGPVRVSIEGVRFSLVRVVRVS